MTPYSEKLCWMCGESREGRPDIMPTFANPEFERINVEAQIRAAQDKDEEMGSDDSGSDAVTEATSAAESNKSAMSAISQQAADARLAQGIKKRKQRTRGGKSTKRGKGKAQASPGIGDQLEDFQNQRIAELSRQQEMQVLGWSDVRTNTTGEDSQNGLTVQGTASNSPSAHMPTVRNSVVLLLGVASYFFQMEMAWDAYAAMRDEVFRPFCAIVLSSLEGVADAVVPVVEAVAKGLVDIAYASKLVVFVLLALGVFYTAASYYVRIREVFNQLKRKNIQKRFSVCGKRNYEKSVQPVLPPTQPLQRADSSFLPRLSVQEFKPCEPEVTNHLVGLDSHGDSGSSSLADGSDSQTWKAESSQPGTETPEESARSEPVSAPVQVDPWTSLDKQEDPKTDSPAKDAEKKVSIPDPFNCGHGEFRDFMLPVIMMTKQALPADYIPWKQLTDRACYAADAPFYKQLLPYLPWATHALFARQFKWEMKRLQDSYGVVHWLLNHYQQTGSWAPYLVNAGASNRDEITYTYNPHQNDKAHKVTISYFACQYCETHPSRWPAEQMFAAHSESTNDAGLACYDFDVRMHIRCECNRYVALGMRKEDGTSNPRVCNHCIEVLMIAQRCHQERHVMDQSFLGEMVKTRVETEILADQDVTLASGQVVRRGQYVNLIQFQPGSKVLIKPLVLDQYQRQPFPAVVISAEERPSRLYNQRKVDAGELKLPDWPLEITDRYLVKWLPRGEESTGILHVSELVMVLQKDAIHYSFPSLKDTATSPQDESALPVVQGSASGDAPDSHGGLLQAPGFPRSRQAVRMTAVPEETGMNEAEMTETIKELWRSAFTNATDEAKFRKMMQDAEKTMPALYPTMQKYERFVRTLWAHIADVNKKSMMDKSTDTIIWNRTFNTDRDLYSSDQWLWERYGRSGLVPKTDIHHFGMGDVLAEMNGRVTHAMARFLTEESISGHAIWITVAWFDVDELIDSLLMAMDRNCRVIFIVDSGTTLQKNRKQQMQCIKRLTTAGAQVGLAKGERGGMQHSKTAFFDSYGCGHRIVGSTNWTKNTLKNEEKSILYRLNQTGRRQVLADLERLWAKCEPFTEKLEADHALRRTLREESSSNNSFHGSSKARSQSSEL